MALPGHPFASPDRQAIERQVQTGRTDEAPPEDHIGDPRRVDGAPSDPGAQGHTRAEQRGDGAPGRTHAKNPEKHAKNPEKHAKNPEKHANSGRNSGVPGQPAPASDGHASSHAPNA